MKNKEKIKERILDALPQLQCKKCTYKDFDSYANAIIFDNEKLNKCEPGSSHTEKQITNILNNKIMLSQKRIDNENIKMSFLVFILFFLSLFILSSLLLIDILDFENSFKLSILTLTNTVSSNIYGIEKIQFSDLLISSKISLIIFMIIAKVELISIFLLIQKFFFKN